MAVEVAANRSAPAAMTTRAVSAATIGNLLEWYDFSVYAFFAGTIARLFFPASNPMRGVLLVFLTYGLGFVMRPVGAMVIGAFGDRYGRKNALIFTVLTMGFGTVLIGVLPTYDTIGSMGAVLLVVARLIQGFSAGGEWGGSTAFIVEYAPEGRRGFIGSFQQVTVVGGLVLGTAVASLLNYAFPDQAMLAWAWRLPFLFGVVLVPIGIYLRAKVEETPKFEELEQRQEVARTPFLDTLRTYPKEVATAFGFTLLWTVGFYIVLNYMPTYMQQQLKMPAPQSLLAVSLGQLALAIMIPFFGHVSDRIGRRPLLIASALVFIIATYPMFAFIVSVHEFWALLVNQLFFAIPLAFFSGAGPAAISEIFPTRVRYTAMSTGYSLAVAIFGGFAPFIAQYLTIWTGDPLALTYYVIASAVITLWVVWNLKETHRERLG